MDFALVNACSRQSIQFERNHFQYGLRLVEVLTIVGAMKIDCS